MDSQWQCVIPLVLRSDFNEMPPKCRISVDIIIMGLGELSSPTITYVWSIKPIDQLDQFSIIMSCLSRKLVGVV